MLESSTHSQHHILGSGSWHQSGSDYCQVLLQVLGLIPSVPVPFPGLGIYLVEAALEADLTWASPGATSLLTLESYSEAFAPEVNCLLQGPQVEGLQGASQHSGVPQYSP